MFEIRIRKTIQRFSIDLELRSEAPITALFGRSGSGKTSVLHMVAGVLRPDDGHIRVDGTTLFDSATRADVAPERRGCGYIFQDGRLFPHLTVQRNLLYGARFAAERPRLLTFDEMTELLGIAGLLERRPATLSGGEAQRVAIGRALMAAPRFLLMDEPLTFLDDVHREEMVAVIGRLRDELRLPILYVSHDRAELARLGAAVVSLERPT